MAQLSDDCFAFGGPMMTVAEAIDLIRQRVQPVSGTETISIPEAMGRILAEACVAAVDVPYADNSAVDGYSVRFADLATAGETILPVTQRVQAGAAAQPIEPGTAARIFTGAPMPQGADTVFMQEDTREADGAVILPAGLKLGANRRFAGEDFKQGTVAVAAGTRLDARHIATLAAVGVTQVCVRRRVRVGVFSTGDELVGQGALHAGAAFDANRPLLLALLRQRGVEVTDLGILRDEAGTTARALAAAAEAHDAILTSGGVSTGEADFVKDAVENAGALTFWRLAIKPGRPVAMGTVRGAAFVGLPGNPVAAFATYLKLAAPLIDQLGGASAQDVSGFSVASAFSYKKKEGRREYVRASLTAEDGQMRAQKFPREGAAMLSSLTETDGFVELGESVTHVNPGDPVTFVPYRLLY